MKRTYIKPAVEVVDIETKATCVMMSWNVKGDKYDPSTDHGYIIEDNENFKKEDDPWNSDNW